MLVSPVACCVVAKSVWSVVVNASDVTSVLLSVESKSRVKILLIIIASSDSRHVNRWIEDRLLF